VILALHAAKKQMNTVVVMYVCTHQQQKLQDNHMISASSGISFGLQADLPADNPSHAHRMVCACALLGRLDDRLHMIQSQRNDKSASDLDKEAEGTNTERSYAFNRDQKPLVQQHMLTCAKESMLLWVFT
jgi:hypothetical protein